MQVIWRSVIVVLVAATSLAIPRESGAQPPAGSTVTATRQKITSAAIDRRRIDRILGASDTSLRVVKPSGASTVLPQATDSVRVRAGDFIFRKTADVPRRLDRAATAVVSVRNGGPSLGSPSADTTEPTVVNASPTVVNGVATLNGEAYAMPYRWLMVDSSGVEHLLVPYFIIDGGGLTYHAPSHTYRGIALVGVEDTLHPDSPPIQFSQPLKMQLTTTSGGNISPLRLSLTHTGLDYDSVTIAAPGETGVRVRASMDQRGIVIPIPVRTMKISLVPLQPSIQAFGLATTDIRLSLPAGFQRSDTASVTLSSTSAAVRPGDIDVVGTRVSTVSLRSGMPGADTIRAYVDGAVVGETVVTFKPPWVFISALIAGLLLGALARLMGGKRWRKIQYFGRELAKGAPFGIIVAIGTALGIDWFDLKLDDTGAWIAIVFFTTLGSWFGATILDRFKPDKTG